MTQPAAPDVLVIGGGVAALCAAIAARQAGACVRLAELAPQALRGGNTRHSRNLRVMHDAPTAFSPECYGADEYLAELRRAAEGQGDPDLNRMLVAQSATIVPWLAAQGVAFQRAGDGLLPFSRRTCFFLGGGKAAMNALYATADGLGVAIGYDNGARGLAVTGGRVQAVDLMTPSGPETLHPGAVVVCCGGAQADRPGLRAWWGEAAERFLVRGTPYADGAILRDLIAQGAATAGESGACHLVAVDARSPEVDGGIVTRVRGIPAGIVVDQAGRRFHDEGGDTGPTRYAVWGRKVAEQPGQTAWLILDALAERRVPPLAFPPLRAATPADLAALAGLEPAALADTVAAYNAAVCGEGRSGRTFGLTPDKTRHARALAEPPFAAIPIRPGITFTCYGVKVDAQARVLLKDGQPISNLHAAGMIMAQTILGTGYLAGAAVAIGAVFGRIAGQEAARHAGR
jgi:tricarballylate dehydrogenase